MSVLIYNPAYPKNKSKAKPLSVAQFDVVKDYIVSCMNSKSRRINEAVVIDMLAKAGLPLEFDK